MTVTLAVSLIMYARLLILLLSLSLPYNAGAAQDPVSGELLHQLGSQYEHGRGVQRNFNKAFLYYCLAADLGVTQAAYNLGWMYFNQRGTPRSQAVAAWWFQQAAKSGDPYARRMLSRLGNARPTPDPRCRPLHRATPSPGQITAWVKRWAPVYGLDPQLVLAVIAAESGFNARAKSPKNAQGLMQLIPATAQRFGVTKILDPAQNMHGGMAYLRWLMKRFNGDVRLVVAAYNAGEGAVESYRGIPPYRETIGYVRRIAQQYPKTTHPLPPTPLLGQDSS